MTNETPPPSQHREPIEADREGVTPSDREWADKVIAVEHPNNHEAFEYAVAEVIRDHRLAFSTPAASDAEAETLLARACSTGSHPHESATIIRGTEWVRKTAAIRAIEAARALPLPKAGEGETIESMIAWGDETFGPCEPERAVSRAHEEWLEMVAEVSGTMQHAIEAADVIICLLRIPLIREAINQKMTKNRARTWKLMGDGTGYHVKAATPSTEGRKGEDQA